MKTLGISFGIGVALQSSFGSAFKTIDEKSKSISKSLKGIDFKKNLSTNLIKLNKEFKQLKTAQKRAGTVSAEFKQKIYASAKALHKAKLEAKQYGIELKNASMQQKILKRYETLKTKNGLDYIQRQNNKNYRDKAKGQMLDKLAIGYAIAAPFKAGIEFESSMARVKALSGATNEEFKRLNSTARQLGASTTFSASEVGQGMQYLAMAGFKANETIKAMPGLLNLASAGQTDLAMTSDIASDILSGFGLKAKDMGNVSDILAKTFTTANTDLAKLGETMKYVGPVARKAGMSLEEASAMAGLLGNVGIKSSQAGTTLRKMLLSLSAPSSGASKTLKKLGVDTLDANGNMRNMVEILGDVAKATKGMGSGEQLSIYKDIFGEEAAAGVAELISQEGAKGITKYLDVIKNYKGTASRIAKQQNDTVAGSFKALGSALEGVSISATSLFLPALKGITLGITSATQWLNGFIENHRTLATVIGGVGGGMIALSVSAFALRYAFSFLHDGYLAIKSSIRTVIFWMSAEGRAMALNRASMILSGIKAKTLAFWQGVIATKTKIATLWTSRYAIATKGAAFGSNVLAFGLKAINLVLSNTPLGWFVKGLMGLATIGTILYKKFEPFRNLIDGIGKTVGGFLSSVGNFFGFGDDKKESKKENIANNTNFNPGATMKKVAVATAVSTQLVASTPPALPKVTHGNKTIQQTYYVKVIVNNPSSNVDIEKAIKQAMLKQGNDRSLSDGLI
jgi:TP901 family phage tail tape measure protein